MKPILLTGMLVAIVGAAIIMPRLGTSVTATNSTATSTVEVVEEEYPSDVLERAVKAQEDVLRRYDLEQEKTRLRAESDVLEARIDEIDKELGDY